MPKNFLLPPITHLAGVGSDDPGGLLVAPHVSVDRDFWHAHYAMAGLETTKLTKWRVAAGKRRLNSLRSVADAAQLLLGLVHGRALGHTLYSTEDWLRQVPQHVVVDLAPVHNWAGIRNLNRLRCWSQVKLPK